jgi:hypothetical protein
MRRGANDYLLEGHIDGYSIVRALPNMMKRKVAEEVLFTEKERTQVTLDLIGDAVLCTDMAGLCYVPQCCCGTDDRMVVRRSTR